ncbi:MAG: SdrD B-like domain-containing protein [Phycisphaerae bacterium]|nr:SdrD B-like domain-containing protein [Tepidisphaeraceae bacterium]
MRSVNRIGSHPGSFEPLESRRLLTVGDPINIDAVLGFPKISIDTGDATAPTTLTYDAGTKVLDLKATTVDVKLSAASFAFLDATIEIQVRVDAAGNLLGGVDGVDDLIITDGTTIFLSGEIRTPTLIKPTFGYENIPVDAPTGSVVEYIFEPTDGDFAQYLSPSTGALDIGVKLFLNNAVMNFATLTGFDFSAPQLVIKGTVGSVPGPGPTGGSDVGKISGFVFDDCADYATANNGLKELGEDGLAGVAVTLWRLNATTGLYEQVGAPQLTGADGSYLFNNLPLGTYRVTEAQPAGYLDGTDAKEGVPLPHPAHSADADTLSGILLDATRTASANNNFGEIEPASLGGYVYSDLNNDGLYNPAVEDGIGGVTIKLERLTTTGAWEFIASTTTSTVPDSGTNYTEGSYSFTGLYPGTYRITEVQPADWRDGKDSVGTLGGSLLCNDQFKVVLKCDQDGTKYNFGEIGLLHGLTGTIGFWANKNGQQMIKLLNADSATLGCSKLLGNWLASNFPNLYGSGAGLNSMAGKTTAQIAARFIQLKDATGQKLDAQLLAVCFAIYTTTRELNASAAGIAFATQHGFVSPIPQSDGANLRNRKWDLDENGDAFASKTIINKVTYFFTADDNTALPADGTLTVWTLLQRTNSFASAGVLWASGMTIIDTDGTSRYFSSTELRNEANVVFSDINQSGDILS